MNKLKRFVLLLAAALLLCGTASAECFRLIELFAFRADLSSTLRMLQAFDLQHEPCRFDAVPDILLSGAEACGFIHDLLRYEQLADIMQPDTHQKRPDILFAADTALLAVPHIVFCISCHAARVIGVIGRALVDRLDHDQHKGMQEIREPDRELFVGEQQLDDIRCIMDQNDLSGFLRTDPENGGRERQIFQLPAGQKRDIAPRFLFRINNVDQLIEKDIVFRLPLHELIQKFVLYLRRFSTEYIRRRLIAENDAAALPDDEDALGQIVCHILQEAACAEIHVRSPFCIQSFFFIVRIFFPSVYS